MKRVILSLLFSLTCFAGPIIVGNGGGESEFNLILAQSQISFFWNLCQQNMDCKSASEESPELWPALQFVETAQLNFLSDSSMTEAARLDFDSRRIDLNQKLLWKPDGRGFSLSDSFDFYLSLIEKSLSLSQTHFHQAFVQLVDRQLKEVNVPVSEIARMKVINLQNGLITLMVQSADSLLDIQSLNLASQIKCPSTGRRITQLKLANLSYGYRADHPESSNSDFNFNSHIRFECSSGNYRAHVMFEMRFLHSAGKFDLDHQVFQINSIEKVD